MVWSCYYAVYCCPVNFKTAEKSNPKPFSIGLRAFFFKKASPRKSNHDGWIRRIGAGQETNGIAQSALSKKASAPFLCKKIGISSSFFPYQPQGAFRSRANVSRLGGTASLEAIPIGRDKAKSRWFSKSKSVCAGGSGQYLDFALYGRRSAAGWWEVVFYQVQK